VEPSEPAPLAPHEVATGLERRHADDVVVLLASMDIASHGRRADDGSWLVEAAEADAPRAREIVREEYPDGFAAHDAAEAARRHRGGPSPHVWMHGRTWIVLAVGLVLVAWFVRMQMVGELTRARLLGLGAISWDQVWVGEYWRLVSGVFVHFDGAHLLTNLVTLLIVGPPLALVLGPSRFVAIFILTGLAGNLASHVLAPTAGLKAGASGAIAGVLGALGGTSLDPGFAGRFARWQILGALAAVYALLVGAGPGADHVAHLGGLLSGIVLGRWLTPPRPPEPAPEPPAARGGPALVPGEARGDRGE